MTLGNDNGTDRQTDRVRRNMRPPPREEGRIISLEDIRVGILLRPTLFPGCISRCQWVELLSQNG